MSLPKRSRWVYGASIRTDWSMTLPPRPWTMLSPTVGGMRKSGAGVPASYVVRRDAVLSLTLRFWASEWPELLAMLTWGQLSETLTWYPDADESESFEVWLDSPAAGEEISPSRDSQYPNVMELAIRIRKVDGTAWDIDYYG